MLLSLLLLSLLLSFYCHRCYGFYHYYHYWLLLFTSCVSINNSTTMDTFFYFPKSISSQIQRHRHIIYFEDPVAFLYGSLYFWPPALWLAPGPGPQFVFTANLCLPTLTETLHLPALVPKLYLPTLTPAMAPNLHLPVQGKILLLLLPQILVLSLPLPLPPPLLLQLLLLPLPKI